jgi:hypothetical protein
MDDYTQKECNYERDKALTECLELVIGLANRLEPMAAGDSTGPRNGTLLSVRQRLITIMDMLPAPEPLTEAEQVARACTEG